ncbi:MAG: hypothetical protein MRY32_09640 [Rickettsiales bacterium]|nr:hypothetical protein [Rickettsiales bacterium]
MLSLCMVGAKQHKLAKRYEMDSGSGVFHRQIRPLIKEVLEQYDQTDGKQTKPFFAARYGEEEFFRRKITNYLEFKGYAAEDIAAIYPAENDTEARMQADQRWGKLYSTIGVNPELFDVFARYVDWEFNYCAAHPGATRLNSLTEMEMKGADIPNPQWDAQLDRVAKMLDMSPSPQIPRHEQRVLTNPPERNIISRGGYDGTPFEAIEVSPQDRGMMASVLERKGIILQPEDQNILFSHPELAELSHRLLRRAQTLGVSAPEITVDEQVAELSNQLRHKLSTFGIDHGEQAANTVIPSEVFSAKLEGKTAEKADRSPMI